MEVKLTPDYKANEPIFWHVFNDLSKNNDFYDKLQERLISTGKLDAGTSVLMIDHIEKDGKIEKSGDYNVYKIGNLPATREGERNML